MLEVSEAAAEVGRRPHRRARADDARADRALPRRRQRLRARARRPRARRDRATRRRGPLRRARGARQRVLVGGRPRRGRAHRDRAARDRRADRALRPPERRAPRAQRHLQPAARAGAGPAAARRARSSWRSTSASPTTRGWTLRAAGRQALLEGRLDEAEAALEQARALFAESGAALTLAATLNYLGDRRAGRGATCARAEEPPARGDPHPASRSRTVGRSSRASGSSRRCCSRRATLDEAERLALDARETVGAADVAPLDDATRARPRPRRPGAGRRGGAAAARGLRVLAADRLPAASDRAARGPRRFLRDRGREDEAREIEETLRDAAPAEPCRPALTPADLRRSVRIALIAWLDASSGDSEITVAGRSNRSSASRKGSARSVPSP